MNNLEHIISQARERAAEVERARQSARFRRVVGRLYAAKLLLGTDPYEPHDNPLKVKDCLWAGTIEPRILELLPALLLKRPSLFADPRDLPEDLRAILRDIRRGHAVADFRGIPARGYLAWVPRIGARGKQPSLLKSFRFQPDDIERLLILKRHGLSETAAIRLGLELAVSKLGPSPYVPAP